LPPEHVPDLVDQSGRFRGGMAQAGARLLLKGAARRQLAAEIEAQFQAFAATGLALDHVNAHRHFHLHPIIAGMILRIGRQYGMTAVRAPVEPKALLDQAERGPGRALATIAAPMARLLQRRLRRAGMTTPDRVLGLAWSGAMTTPRVAGLLRALPAGFTELYLHPATEGGFTGAAPGYRYAEELAALVAPDVIAAAQGIPRGGFADAPRGP
jgi:hopanoid biosynthesis associated protein HpnK